jgi:hypothetical protein
MKRKFLLLCAAVAVCYANRVQAQWTASTVLTTTTSNVGVGTTTPDSKVHVLSGYGILSGGGNCTYSGTTALKIRWTTPTVMPLCSTFTNTAPHVVDIHRFQGPPFNNVSPYFTIASNGNVAIGTDPTPDHKLNVAGKTLVHGSTVHDLFDAINNQNNVASGSSVIWAAYKWGSTQNNNPMLLQATGAFPGGGQDRFVVKNNGEVVIGNAFSFLDPNKYRLYVEKGILTERVKVAIQGTADWADYVFDENYRLKSLDEVESFVKSNKHLPGVPSAAQLVKDGGIDVNQMFAKQMEKIEELTLYMIQLKKENKELREAIEKLQR